MIIITGPQDTDEAVGHLMEMAGVLDAVPTYNMTVQWTVASALYCLTGWERCSAAVADVTIAQECGLVVYLLAV